MAGPNAVNYLVQQALDIGRRQILVLSQILQALFKILVTELDHEVNVSVCHNHVFEPDYVSVAQLGQNRNFSHSCTRDTVCKIFDLSPLKGEHLTCLAAFTFENVAVCALSNRWPY